MSSIEIYTALSDRDRNAIVDGVVSAIKPLLETRPKLVDGDQMASILGISRASLDRLRSSERISSVLIGTSRRYIPEEVIAALKSGGSKDDV